jgi:hypothetical protein
MMHGQQNVKRLKLLFTNRMIGISFFTGSGPFPKHQVWPSIYWMIGAISTRSKRPECDDDTTVSSQGLSIHDSCIKKIYRHFSSVHEISLCKWDAHVSMFTEEAEREIMCSLRDRNWGRKSFYKWGRGFSIWIRGEVAELVEHTTYITP